jgi:lantibiotic modifying enzyme
MDKGLALAAASAIANHLCETAFFHQERCTWCGTVKGLDDEFGSVIVHQTLGSDLYDGTAGVALFLGEIFGKVCDHRFRRAAEGGIARALDRVEATPKEQRFGVYSGTVGVVCAAVRLGQLLERPDLILRGRQAMASLAGDLERPFLIDIIGGAAGSIPALLMLADTLAMPELGLSARKLGEVIVAAASKGADGWSWKPDTEIESARNLTGFAHGAAGIGWSLLELYRMTQETRFLEGALEAFRYENRWFQQDQDNWPDFREHDGVAEPAPCMVAWCHGAAGIGLARLAALQICEQSWLRRDAEAAVRASKRALAHPDHAPESDFCLCHGQCGIIAFLLRAGEVLGDIEARDVALIAAHAAAARFGSAPEAWPVGFDRGSTPSLMTGLAGIGYFYLGLANPELPSVLLL